MLGSNNGGRMRHRAGHFAQPTGTNIRANIEVMLLEFLAGVICAGMDFWAEHARLPFFYACIAVALMCFYLTFHNLHVIFKSS